MRRPDPCTRLLVVFLAGSLAVHAAVLIVLPGFLPNDRDTSSVVVMEVVLVQAEPPPQVLEKPPSAPAQPKQRAPEQVAVAPVLRVPSRQPDASPYSSALPGPRPETESIAPVPGPAETGAAPGESRTEVANVAVTPPGFSAAYLRNPAPAYPIAAKRSGTQGTVTLRVLVTREGLPARVDLEKTSGSFHLDRAALEAVRTWRFVPARRGAEAIESWMVVPIVFRLEGTS